MHRSRRVPIRSLAQALALAAAAAAVAPAAHAIPDGADSVDLELLGSFSGKGTIRPATERERFILPLGIGAKVAAVAKAKSRKGAFVPSLDLIDPSEAAIATGTKKGRKSTLKAGPLTAGGDHRVRVFGDGLADGDYTVSVTVKPQKSFKGTGTAGAASLGLHYEFGAPAGAKARIVLKPSSPASGFVPALESLVAPGGATIPLTGDRVGPFTLDEPGDWSVRFHDGGAVGGDWTCQVSLQLPRPKRSKFDISAGRLTGPFVDDQPVYGRVVTPTDLDTLIDPPDVGGPLDGASVLIPAGGAPFPVVITMNETAPITPGPGEYPAGPAVQFGPAGLQFEEGKPAVITVAYDPAQFDDIVNELTIYVLDEGTGEVVAVEKPYDFSVFGVVSFPSPHFSAYMVASPNPPSLRGDWVLASLEGRVEPDFGGAFSAQVGTLTFDDDDGIRYSMSSTGLLSDWVRDTQGDVPGPGAVTLPVYELSDGYAYEIVPNLYELYSFSQELTYVVQAPGGDALFQVRNPEIPPQSADVSFALRRARGSPTETNIAGRWHLAALGALGQENGGDPRTVDLRTNIATGSVTFGTAGKATLVLTTDRENRTGYPDGTWTAESVRRTMSVVYAAASGEVRLYFDDEDEGGGRGAKPLTEIPDVPPLRLLPCLDGDVLMGAFDTTNHDPLLIVLVREGRGFTKGALDGAYGFLGFEFAHTDAAFATEEQRLGFVTHAGTVNHDGAGGATFVDVPAILRHASNGETESVVDDPVEDGATYALSKDGRWSLSSGFSGFFLPGTRGVLIGTNTTEGTFFVGVPGIDPNPEFAR